MSQSVQLTERHRDLASLQDEFNSAFLNAKEIDIDTLIASVRSQQTFLLESYQKTHPKAQFERGFKWFNRLGSSGTFFGFVATALTGTVAYQHALQDNVHENNEPSMLTLRTLQCCSIALVGTLFCLNSAIVRRIPTSIVEESSVVFKQQQRLEHFATFLKHYEKLLALPALVPHRVEVLEMKEEKEESEDHKNYIIHQCMQVYKKVFVGDAYNPACYEKFAGMIDPSLKPSDDPVTPIDPAEVVIPIASLVS